MPFTATLKSDGAVVNPCVLNIITGQSIRILTTLTPGQVIEIYRTTTDKLAVKRTEDGTEENIFSLLDEDSDLLELAPGDNLLKATADSGETSLQVTVRFYPMVFGHSAGGDLVTLDVLDELTLARLGRVEVWVSLYWDEPYNTEGEFTLEVRPTEENLSLLREGRWLRRSDSDVPMRICHRSNENQDSNLVVTGFPGTWIFTKRACTSTVKSENAEAAMRRLVSAMQPWPKLELGAAGRL